MKLPMTPFWAAAFVGSLILPAGASSENLGQTDDIVSIATGDWNGDGVRDAVILTAPGITKDDNGISIYLGEAVTGRLRLKIHVKNFVWGNDVMAGQTPHVEALKNGSFAVTSQNEAIGRNRWAQRLTIAYRDNQFLVAGFTHDSYDTLDMEAGQQTCDLNILSGKGVVNGKTVSFRARKVAIDEWLDDYGFIHCERN